MNSAAAIHVMRLEQASALAHRARRTWLHPSEIAELERFASPGRRACWLAGRYCLKRQILTCRDLKVAPSALRIVSRTSRNVGMAPVAWLRNEPLAIGISLSHSEHFVAVAIGEGSCAVGIDLVDADGHRDGDGELTRSLNLWFSREELEAGAPINASHLRAAWCAKEAVFKTLIGEPFRPRQISLSPRSADVWIWSYGQAPHGVSGRVELHRHPRFLLAIAQIGDSISPC